MEKLKIIVLEGGSSSTVVEGQFNPKEIEIQKSIPWEHQPLQGPSDLKYTQSEARTMSFELLFDGFSTGTSIQDEVDALQALSAVDTALKRPPKLRVVWGPEGVSGGFPRFEAVIEEISVKYTMFDVNGRPVRATIRLKLREARHLMYVKLA